MVWKSKPVEPVPKVGDRKIVRLFCWWPVACDDGYSVWLGYRSEIFTYKRYKVRLPLFPGMKCVPPIVDTIGWVKDSVLAKMPFTLYREIMFGRNGNKK